MSKTIEEAALRYAAQQVNHSDEFEDMAQVSSLKFSANNLSHAFEEGADFALSHQWRSVEDELPEDGDYLVYESGMILTIVRRFKGYWSSAQKPLGKILYWMPIPSLNPEQR